MVVLMPCSCCNPLANASGAGCGPAMEIQDERAWRVP
jgi:hypothetical protein